MRDFFQWVGASGVILSIGAAWSMVRSTRKPKAAELPEPDSDARAIGILKERYARGEIDLDEFLRMRGYLQLEDQTR